MRMNYLLWSSLRANWPAYFMGACLKVGWWACDSFTRMKMECWDMLTEARANLANTAQPQRPAIERADRTTVRGTNWI